ncbi:Calcyphosin-2 Calcyphosine-2 [Triplophysa tibetana]|uniref:Calcyphosin-2 Calcyphosine-2 n=1 Tax=Triplophysa tibetana TaxID=1572043 RepID=A0A5A9P0T0_9TELE|nr:Calcyphosin-2 Calcyphosine-2 [Triplophysa tibetana]
MSENNKTLPIQQSPRRPKNVARHGPRPAEVPVLQLDTLQDTLNEYLAVIPKDAAVSRDVSAFSWGSPPLTNSNQCFETNITEKNLVDHGESLQLSSRVPTQRSPLYTHKSNTDPPDLTSENPAQPRAVISDPEQNAVSVSPMSGPPRYTRTLHHTKVKTQTSLTENLLSNKLRFNGRILSRCGREACRELIGFFFTCDQTLTVYEYRNFGKNRWNALPFITRGVYQNRGRPYSLQDISQGAELHFCTDGPHLPHSLRQQPRISLKVNDVDETAKRALLFQYGESLFHLSEEEIDERNTLKAIQDVVLDRLRGRAVQTLIHLGRHLQNLDSKADGVRQKELLRKSLMGLLCLTQQDFEAMWRIVSRCAEGRVHPADVMRAVTGEMSENRKAVFLKVYVKLDPNKTGFISMSDVEKFYRGKQDSHTTHEADPNADFWAFIKQAEEVNKRVSYAQFEDYYEGLSIEIPDDEEYINNLRSMWGI